VYNFSSDTVTGTLAVEQAPAEWQVPVAAERTFDIAFSHSMTPRACCRVRGRPGSFRCRVERAMFSIFLVKPESPALKLGFIPIDVSKIGLRNQK
jgi:hypothetical protein